MGLLDRVTIKVSLRAYQKAVCGNRVYGKLGISQSICVRALLGKEIKDVICRQDENTEHRKFLNCTVEFAENLELLKEGKVIKGASLYNQTISIFY